MGEPFELTDPPGPAPESPEAPDYLDNLNETQALAVKSIDGPVLVLAGAGTGKTRVLTTRLAHVLLRGHANPWEVLAVTFTNKAANQMKSRVAQLLGRAVEGWWVGTFHATGARIVRAHAEVVGLKSNFTIIDADDQVRLVKQLLESYDIDPKQFPPRVLSSIIQRWKDRGLTPDKVSDAEGATSAGGEALPLYAEYQKRLVEINAADFGDLLLHCLTIFNDEPDILAKYQKQFRYLLVDEYQDTNVSQYLWLRLLAQGHQNICCVGDDDQSIYSWRGAEVENILRFEKDFPAARIVRLERNYRSTPHILAAASGLIAHNEGRLGKTLWTEINGGDKVRVVGVWDGEEEARAVGDEIETLHTKKQPLNEMAVLVRAGFQTREFEERLITLGVPYRVIGGARFYERQEIRDAIAYFRVVAQPDDDLAFERIVNVPKRGLGPATLQTLHKLSRAERISLTTAVGRLIETDELKPKPRATLATMNENFERWRGLMGDMHHTELAEMILDQSGYIDMWRSSKALEAPGRLDNVKELLVALEDFESFGEFLEHVSLVMENDDSTVTDKVNLMTVHGAKGLEFDTVFLAGWEEGLFPHPRTLDDSGVAGLEEERRLAYVGLTRARKTAIVSFTANRRIHGQWQSSVPSRFVEELPEDHIDVRSQPGLYGGGQKGFRGGLGESLSPFAGTGRKSRKSRGRRPEAKFKDAPDSSDFSGGDQFKIGMRIFHQKFGYGKIVASDGGKLEIDFEKAGSKKVMASFVETV